MLGYLIAVLAGLLLLILVGVAFFSPKSARPRQGRATPVRATAVGAKQPAADEPTPGKSVTAESEQTDAALRRTPPA